MVPPVTCARCFLTTSAEDWTRASGCPGEGCGETLAMPPATPLIPTLTLLVLECRAWWRAEHVPHDGIDPRVADPGSRAQPFTHLADPQIEHVQQVAVDGRPCMGGGWEYAPMLFTGGGRLVRVADWQSLAPARLNRDARALADRLDVELLGGRDEHRLVVLTHKGKAELALAREG